MDDAEAMKALQDEIKKRMGDLGEIALASRMEVKRDVIRDIFKGKRPNIFVVARIAQYFGCSVDDLLGAGGAGQTMNMPARADDGIDYQGSAYAAVPVFDIRISGGPGSIAYDGEPEHWHLFRLEFLRQLAFDGIHNLALLRVTGDSMEPTLRDGDHVLVDRSVTRAGRDGMYVIRLDKADELQVKRVQPEGRGTVTIKGDNPIYGPKAHKAANVEILGRVVWLGRAL